MNLNVTLINRRIKMRTMNDARPGDKVRVIKLGALGWESRDWCSRAGLKLGKIYTVKNVYGADDEEHEPSIRVEEDMNEFLIALEHFELVNTTKENEVAKRNYRHELDSNDADRESIIVDMLEELEALRKPEEPEEPEPDDRIPTENDIGRWAQGRDKDNNPWCDAAPFGGFTTFESLPFRVGDDLYKQARLVDHPTVVNWSYHDGSGKCPVDALGQNEMLLVQCGNGNCALSDSTARIHWNVAKRYTILKMD